MSSFSQEKGVAPMNPSSEQMDKVTQNLMQACDEMGATYRKSMDAVMESTAALTKGCDELSRNFGSLMQEQMSRALSAGKTIMSAKSMQEFADLQAGFMKECFDQWMASTGKLSEISVRVTQEAIEPVTKHANDTMSKAAQKAQQGRAA
jgi:phasin family protein